MNFSGINRRAFLKWFALANISFLILDNKKTWGQKILAAPSNSRQNIEIPSGSDVLRVHSPEVISSHHFIPDSYLDSIREDKLDEMLSGGIREFTKQEDLKRAWFDILTNYKKGDKIAIKPNFNFLNHGYKFTITSPQLINSVVKQLIEAVGVNPQEIFLYDLCKKIPGDMVRNRISYPINYIERTDSKTIVDKMKHRLYYGLASADLDAEINMREDVVDENGNPVKCYIPKVVTQAQHLINMPLLTNHIFIANSGSLKNHFGTVRFSNFNAYPDVLHGKGLNKSIVDINQHPHIRNKTRIIIGDGLYGVFDRGDGDGKRVWKTFNHDFPKSIFISKDPVALDSVMASIVIQEREVHQLNILSTEYLNDAMGNGLGIYEISKKNTPYKKIEYSTLIL